MYPIFLLHHHHLLHPRPPLHLLHLHRPHRPPPPLHHLHEASTTTHHCRSPSGRTQARAQAQECRNGARHRAQLPSIWNGPLLLLRLPNRPPLHLLLRPPQLLSLLSLQLQLLSERGPQYSQQQREEQQQQQQNQQQRKQQQQHLLLEVVVFLEVAVQDNSSTKFFLLSNFNCVHKKGKT